MGQGQPQRLRPVHCVHKTQGAALVASLDVSKIHHVVYKGVHVEVDS